MQTTDRNRLVIERHDNVVRQYVDQLLDYKDNSSTQPYLEQLIHNQNNDVTQEEVRKFHMWEISK
ncbi:hypothetical protein H5410_003566 [Solanum commersonii]|uniref:Uncharacterized protein n=1 Tax=Solanum commersonii TaxID=4109 RepID=A0A9J6B591_SOLCO|nr:hypothetical protein H5410_003566 [Solanum commersonii]